MDRQPYESDNGLKNAILLGLPFVVYFDRRAHNPVLREAQLEEKVPPIPWLGNHGSNWCTHDYAKCHPISPCGNRR